MTYLIIIFGYEKNLRLYIKFINEIVWQDDIIPY